MSTQNNYLCDYISVIIPVYKVEMFLKRCVDSVLKQTYEKLEIILVDDGSPDNSPAICDDYANKDTRVRVIHKNNGGLAYARNAGMKIACGEYLFFLDSDDWLEQKGLEILIRTAKEQKGDFVRYRAIRSGWPGTEGDIPCMVEPIRELEEGVYDRNRIIKEIYPRLLATDELSMGAIVGAWSALYRTAFLKENGIYFYEDVKFSEDLIFSANVVKAAKQFYFINTPGVYHYFFNPNSISKSFRKDRWQSCKRLIRHCEQDFANDIEYDFSDEIERFRWFCIMMALNERKYLKSIRAKKKYCVDILHDQIVKETKLTLSLYNVSWKQKILMASVKMGIVGLFTIF